MFQNITDDNKISMNIAITKGICRLVNEPCFEAIGLAIGFSKFDPFSMNLNPDWFLCNLRISTDDPPHWSQSRPQ
jgi:hypothetical protein